MKLNLGRDETKKKIHLSNGSLRYIKIEEKMRKIKIKIINFETHIERLFGFF